MLVCGGDLIIRLNPKLDASKIQMGQPGHLNKTFKGAMQDIWLIDVWRELNPSRSDFTYFSNLHSVHSRIDYFLIFQKDFHRVDDCSSGTMDLSDHSPVYMKLHLFQYQRNTFWSLNIHVLNHMKDQIMKDITEYLEQNENGEVSPPTLWDTCKAVLRGKTIGYSLI